MATAQPTYVPASAQPLHQQHYTPPNSQGRQQTDHFHPRSAPSTSTQSTPSSHSPLSNHHHHQQHNAPIMPQLALAKRQIRPPKSPMYIPAALRPTDRPQRASPLTPPRSLHGSTDSLDKNADPTRPTSRRSTDPGRGKQQQQQQLDRVSEASSHEELATGVGSQATSKEPIDDMSDLTPLTGDPPTRHHWKADSYASLCDGPTCQKTFGLFERRHHCRHCGNIFCKEHSSLHIPLDQNADFHPRGHIVRSCGHCLARYEEWLEARREMIKMGRHTGETSQGSPVRQIGPTKSPKSPDAHKGSFVGSLTRDWNWSTF